MSHPTCAICGREADGANHVRVEVQGVPPEERPKVYHFHPWCFDRAQSWERGL